MKRNIHQSNFKQILPNKKSNDEIAQMAYTYNNVMAQLEDLHDKQQQCIA